MSSTDNTRVIMNPPSAYPLLHQSATQPDRTGFVNAAPTDDETAKNDVAGTLQAPPSPPSSFPTKVTTPLFRYHDDYSTTARQQFKPLLFPPSPPPTNSDPKHNIPLPSFYPTGDPGPSTRYSGTILDPPTIMKRISTPFETPISPPPTVPTSTKALPPSESDLPPIPEHDDDDGDDLSLLGLPSPPQVPYTRSNSLLSPISPDWETSEISSDMPDSPSSFTGESILLDTHDLDLGPPRTRRCSSRHVLCDLDARRSRPTLSALVIPGLSCYPSPAWSCVSPASSTDMQLSTPHSRFFENLESDLFDNDATPRFHTFSQKEPSPLSSALSVHPSDLHGIPSPELGFVGSGLDLTTFEQEDVQSQSSPSLRFSSLVHLDSDRDEDELFPSPASSTDMQLSTPHSRFFENLESDLFDDDATPTLHKKESGLLSSALPVHNPLDLHAFSSPKLSFGSALDLATFEQQNTHSPSSPSLRSSSLPPLDSDRDEDELFLLPTSPSQPLLALPGADVDDTLIPWDEPPSSSFSSLLTFDDALPRSVSPELDSSTSSSSTLFDVDISAFQYSETDETRKELQGLGHLRRQYKRAERDARNAEGKMKAQHATTRMDRGGYGWGVGKESEYGDRARFEARKRVKREKERGREVGELVRLGMKKKNKKGCGVDVSDGGGKTKDDKKTGVMCIDQLVAKMVLRRRDHAAYRPLTGWRPLGHPSSPLVVHAVTFPEPDGEGGDVPEDMVVDVGDSPSTIEETLTPRTEGDDGAMLVDDDDDDDGDGDGCRGPWLTFASMDDEFRGQKAVHEQLSSWWKNSRDTDTDAPFLSGLGFI